MVALASRIARLEALIGQQTPPFERAFTCVVRKGHEDKDRVAAFAELGTTPTDRDLVIVHRAVSPRPDDRMDDLRPYARLVG